MARTTSLDLVREGVRAVIKSILENGLEEFTRRLRHMGFIPGAEIEVINNNGHGPVVIRIRDIEVSIGRGLAKRILVEVSGH